MDINELKQKLNFHKVPVDAYSLYEGLKIDAIILQEVHGMWEVFYQDERGGQSGNRTFTSENDACDYIWSRIEWGLQYSSKDADKK